MWSVAQTGRFVRMTDPDGTHVNCGKRRGTGLERRARGFGLCDLIGVGPGGAGSNHARFLSLLPARTGC
jgi:hypothetical protein